MNKKLNLNKLLVIWKKIASRHNIAWRNSFLKWDLPKNVNADFALTLALPISHKTKIDPKQIAQKIVKEDDFSNLQWTITKQGYINFCLPPIYYQKFLTETWEKQGENLHGEKKEIHLNLEYVSANPTGYLHLAHFRHAIIGNTLANVYQLLGHKITREYYINDCGKQITSLINSVYYFYHLLQGVSSHTEPKKIEYSGRSSQEVAKKLIKKWGDEYINKELNKEEITIWKKEILCLILDRIKQDLEECGIKFDVWFSETSLYEKNSHFQFLTELKEKNLIYSQEKATFFRSSLSGDDKDRVIIKQNGDYTYFFSDILYHQDKLKRANRLVNIMGADHHGYISRIKSVCQLLGYKPENVRIILVQMVNLLTKKGSERFSKRIGNTIELEEALKYIDINQLKFFLLEKDPNQPLSINTELLRENKEKTRLYYIQYAHARCHQIFQKSEEKKIAKISSNINLLKQERGIFNLLIRFPFILENIVEENKPHHLINYLYELAKVWQVYYQNNIILEQKNQELTSQKLLLVKNIQIILKLGLSLAGITSPDRM